MSIPTDVERDLPPVLKETQDPGWLPGLDIPDLTDDQLIAMARRIENHAHIRWCWHVLAYNRSSAAIRDAARRDLRKSLFGELCGDDKVVGGWADEGMTCQRAKGHDGNHRSGAVSWGTIEVKAVIDGDEFLERMRIAIERLKESKRDRIARRQFEEVVRLDGKAEGVRLAMSYIEELTR
jgi:hypothetical protein